VAGPRRPHHRAARRGRRARSRSRDDRKALARRATRAALTFSGLRIGELWALRWRDVDLASGRITVRASKTDAGMRRVDLLPALRDELATHKTTAPDISPDALVFSSGTGGRRDRTRSAIAS
jgi:integrase